MNTSLNKLFNSQKSSSVHYLETDLIEAPIRKQLVDLHLLFEKAVEYHNISDKALSFKYYAISYSFAIDNILDQFSAIQRRISTQGVNSENIQQFKNFTNKARDITFIATLYLHFAPESQANWKSFVRGYRDAERSVRGICEYVYTEQRARQLSDAMIYTSFWELTSRERVELPADF